MLYNPFSDFVIYLFGGHTRKVLLSLFSSTAVNYHIKIVAMSGRYYFRIVIPVHK